MRAISVLMSFLMVFLVIVTWQYSLADDCTTVIQFQQDSRVFYVDGVTQPLMDTAPVNNWDRLFLAIRYVTDSLTDTEIAWDDSERRVTINSNDGKSIVLWIGENTTLIDGASVQIDPDNPDVVPFINDGRTLLPLRFVCENLGADGEGDIEWDAQTRVVIITFHTSCSESQDKTHAYKKPEILRDKYGVAHVFSETDQGAFYGLGYVMGYDRPIQTLKLYAEVRGISYLFNTDEDSAYKSDSKYLNLRIWYSVSDYYESMPNEVKFISQAFADGFNDALSKQTDLPDWAFEVSPIDPLAMSKRLMINKSFDLLAPELSELSRITQTETIYKTEVSNQSNEWALAPEKTSTGYAYLQADPHGHFRFESANKIMEVQLKGETFNFLGGVQSGTLFSCFFGTNGHLAWSATANGPDVADLYELTLSKNNTHYVYEESEIPLDIEVIETGNGRKTRRIWSHYGPVIYIDSKNAKAYSVKLSNMEIDDMLSENLARIRSKTIEEYKSACSTLSYPTGNFAVVSTTGDIFYYYNARCYRRNDGFKSRHHILDGSNSQNEWGDLIPFDQLPQEVNPDDGWFQNCNVAPWFISPQTSIENTYPIELCVPAMSQGLRGQLATRYLFSGNNWNADSLKDLVFNTYSLHAQRFIPAIAGTVNSRFRHKESLGIVNGLADWDYSYDKDFELGKAFEIIADDIVKSNLFKSHKPIPEWNQLSNEQRAFLVDVVDLATEWLLDHYGRVRKPWGECTRLFVGDKSFPIGCPDHSFESLHLASGQVDDNGVRHINQGSSFMMLFEMSNPIKAWSCYPLGLNENLDSHGFYDASQRYSDNVFKPCYFTRDDVLVSLEEDTKDDVTGKRSTKTSTGETHITKKPVNYIGNHYVSCKLHEHPNYVEDVPICVSSLGFHMCIDTTEIVCIKTDYLWLSCRESRLGIVSEGVYNHEGPDCIKAFTRMIASVCGGSHVWDDVRNYNFKGLNGGYNYLEIPFSGVVLMCKRVREDSWINNLAETQNEYDCCRKE
jgi:acyl-homoserine-lactone acylase